MTRHQRDTRRIRPPRIGVKLNHTPAITSLPRHRAARRRGQCPKPRTFAVAVGAQRRSIDGAEHSAILIDVMAEKVTQSLTQNRGAQRDSFRVHIGAMIGTRVAARGAPDTRPRLYSRSRALSSASQ